MDSKVVIIVSTGDKMKAAAGLRYAYRAQTERWIDDVKVIFFGPSEWLLVGDQDIASVAKDIVAVEKPVACKAFADRDGITGKLEEMGLTVDFVGPIISEYIKRGYVPLVF